MGRPWWCRAGDAVPWSGDIWSRHNSQHLVDPYTITHVLHGVALYGVLWALLRRFTGPQARAALALAVETAWEIVENTDAMIEHYRATTISLDYYGDSVVNSMSDIGAMMLGFWLARRIPTWASVVLIVVMEVAVAAIIRDNLALNILMLIYPLEAVKRWQMGG
jgi:hypothetical protein